MKDYVHIALFSLATISFEYRYDIRTIDEHYCKPKGTAKEHLRST